MMLHTLRQRQNGHLFPDDTFKHIFLNENIIQISLKFVTKGPINGNSALVPMMVRLPMHIYITQPQWVNTLKVE